MVLHWYVFVAQPWFEVHGQFDETAVNYTTHVCVCVVIFGPYFAAEIINHVNMQ